MTAKELISVFKKHYIIIVSIPLIIASVQLHTIYKKSQLITNEMIVSFYDENYMIVGDSIKILSSPYFFQTLNLPKDVEFVPLLQSQFQFKLIIKSTNQETLNNAILTISAFISAQTNNDFVDTKAECKKSLDLLVLKLKNIEKNFVASKTPNDIKAQLELRTKNCVRIFRQESNLVNVNMSEEGKLNKSEIQQILLNLHSELITLDQMQIKNPKVNIGNAIVKQSVRKDMLATLANFFFSVLFFTILAHFGFKKHDR